MLYQQKWLLFQLDDENLFLVWHMILRIFLIVYHLNEMYYINIVIYFFLAK